MSDEYRAEEVIALAQKTGRTIREVVAAEGIMTSGEFDAFITPEAVCRLGTPK